MSFDFEPYHLAFALFGLALLLAACLPPFLTARPMTFVLPYMLAGAAFFSLPLDVPRADPVRHGELVEHLTELAVIVSLMGVGLKLDRPLGWRTWATTWRLLAVAMPLTIAGAALLGGWLLGLAPAAALLLGAALAPTDPVMATDVQVRAPNEDGEDDVRFALSSEAGLNDGLAFPFTWLAILVAQHGTSPDAWLSPWLLRDVLYRIAAGVAVGAAAGWLVGRMLFRRPRGAKRAPAHAMEGFLALAATLGAYGLAELAEGYGFIAVFVAALGVLRACFTHEYHGELAGFIDGVERLLMALLLALLGGALLELRSELTGPVALAAALLILVVRPLAGMVALAGRPEARSERWAVSFFGIRGIGTLYYMAFGLERVDLAGERTLWAVAALTIALSALTHGLAATPLMGALDRLRRRGPPRR